MKRWLAFVAVPLVVAVFLLLEWAVSFALGPREGLPFVLAGPASEGRTLQAAAAAGEMARLDRAMPLVDAAGEAAGGAVILFDEAVRAPTDRLPGGGSPFRELEMIKNRAWAGSDVVIGYRALADSGRDAALADLAETAGIAPPRWVGFYAAGLDRGNVVPADVRKTWEAEAGRPWNFRGDGVVLEELATRRVIVLRRGVELGGGGLRVVSRAAGGNGSLRADGYHAGWFAIAEPLGDTKVVADFVLDLSGPGADLLGSRGLPSKFPALCQRSYGGGRVWTMCGDFAGRGVSAELLGFLPVPRVEARLALDSPESGLAHFWRILVPLLDEILATRKAAASAFAPPKLAAVELRSEGRFLQRKGSAGEWRPWFVRGVDIGASIPGSFATDPPADDGYWLDTFARIAATGFDSIRVYTLLPPAFYRALARFNLSAPKPLLFFQGIWLDEDPPGRDLLDPRWFADQLSESDLCEAAVHGEATIAPRRGKSWGDYRVDASPWLAGFLVGRELLPEEVEATVAAHPDNRWNGAHFTVTGGHPIEAFLASWADHVQSRELSRWASAKPIGFVSWPTLDPLRHPGEWEEGSSLAPYQDRDTVDFRFVTTGPAERAGWFTAFHIYPNYPDFLTRDVKYDLRDPTGMARYGAYLSDLYSVLPKVPFIVAEFGLSTGFGTAHIHPEGLDHGGLTEEAQAEGLVRLFRTIAQRGAGGGMVFEWSDEWSKKTWTTEPFMIPFDRHVLWHNTIDPEENYGIEAWTSAKSPVWSDSGKGIRTASDLDAFLIEVGKEVLARNSLVEIGLDVVPGDTGEYRLDSDGPLSPQGSEFKLRISLAEGRPVSATLLVAADYDRGAGKLWPLPSYRAGFTTIATLVNAGKTTQDGIRFPPLYENGSRLPLDSSTGPGLVSQGGDGSLVIRLPWSRLNFSDPSSRRILLDSRDVRPISAEDAIGTTTIDSIGIWAIAREEGKPGYVFVTDRDRAWRAPLPSWDSVEVLRRDKRAVGALKSFLGSWNPIPATR